MTRTEAEWNILEKRLDQQTLVPIADDKRWYVAPMGELGCFPVASWF
ncbi:MAG: hypothetical protein U0934_07085 [Pseudotabrizicola sp.]|nr:hypothetical protein [Pseudotabrizicola sp.]MDZ7573705.1 hypothetical protein [Pseudotabrizicola sp.]